MSMADEPLSTSLLDSPENLREFYYGKKMSKYEMADAFDVTKGTIDYYFRKHDIETRTMSEAQVLSALKRGLGGGFQTHPSGYEVIFSRDSGEGESRTVLHHRLLAVAEWGFEAVEDNIVHHKNGIRWDNRIDNLQLMTASEHSQMHAEDRTRNKNGQING